MKKYNFKTWSGDPSKDNYEYHYLTPESQELLEWIRSLESSGIKCCFDLLPPRIWENYSHQEKTVYLEKTPVDIFIECVFFSKGGNNEVFLKLEEHKLITRIHIFGGNIDCNSFSILKAFKKLEGLLLYGDYGDELVPHLLACENLKQLDIQTTHVTSVGIKRINQKFSNAELWLPRN